MGRALALLTAIPLFSAASPANASVDEVRYERFVDEAKSAMMQDPAKALQAAKGAVAVAISVDTPRDRAVATARAQWLWGEALSRLDHLSDAERMLARALAPVVQFAPNDRLHGDILLSRGWVKEAQGRIAAGMSDFQKAFSIYRAAGELRGQAKALQNIAGIYQDAGDNEHAQRYYSQAAEIYRGDPTFSLAAYNNVGESLRQLGRFSAAEHQFELALDAARAANSPLLAANVLTNLSATRLQRGNIQDATRIAYQALALTSHHEAADERPFVYGVLAQIAVARHDDAAATKFIGHTFADVDIATTPIAYRDFHKLAADIYSRQAMPELALAHLRAWKRLDDNVRAVAATTNAALMAAHFDFSTQNLRIAQLQANRAHLHETVLVIVVSAVSVISALLLVGMISLRRSRNRLRAANRDLTKALDAKSDFLAMTSHEIRTPLNGILGMTQVMLADHNLNQENRTRVAVVHSAGETMRSLVDDILDLSKMDAGNLTIVRAPFRLHDLITNAVALWRSKAEAKGLAFILDLEDCPKTVEGDSHRLQQILFNLLSNAVKFTDVGSVSLVARPNGDKLELTVSDTGIGIAREHHDLIFEKFQQADASTTRRYGGTGLGLAICRNLISAMDGSISVNSALGAGAIFSLRLPLQITDALGGFAPVAGGERSHVLLLDPNALTRRALAKAVREEDSEAVFVDDADKLLEKIAEGAARCAVVQYQPVASCLAEISAVGHRVGVPLIILCAPDEEACAPLIGASSMILHKPIAAGALSTAIRNVRTQAELSAAA